VKDFGRSNWVVPKRGNKTIEFGSFVSSNIRERRRLIHFYHFQTLFTQHNTKKLSLDPEFQTHSPLTARALQT